MGDCEKPCQEEELELMSYSRVVYLYMYTYIFIHHTLGIKNIPLEGSSGHLNTTYHEQCDP